MPIILPIFPPPLNCLMILWFLYHQIDFTWTFADLFAAESSVGITVAANAYADLRCGLAAGFFAAVSFAGFLPAIGISISFWPAAALRGFLPGFFSAVVPAGCASMVPS
jgi:hypothetical protein